MSTFFSAPAPHDVDTQIVETRTFGEAHVTAILDAESRMSTAAVFARVSAPVPPTELAARYPREFTLTAWRFRIRCFLVRTPGSLVLVDAGAGPADSFLSGLLGVEGRLLSVFRGLGVKDTDVEHVVLTHAHDDHVGWATLRADGGYRPTFERATYHLHSADVALAGQLAGSPTGYWERTFEPLQRSGRLSVTTNALALGRVLSLINAPGHTPGHRCLLLTADDADVLFTGDLLHFGFQLEDPERTGPFDQTPGAGNGIRGQLLRPRPGRSLVLASTHLPDAFTVLDAG